MKTNSGSFYSDEFDYLTEELEKHRLKLIDYDGPSKCGQHAPRITQCKKTGKIYDEFNCIVFKDEKEWKEYDKGNRNVGEIMGCLKAFIKTSNDKMRGLL